MLITGAGRGIGRAEALHCADAGANVVVNDPGVQIDGSGGDRAVAAAVVEEIRERGGNAVADIGSVADWDDARRMVDRAVSEFGDLHAVVNNATIEINKGLEQLSEDDFDDVIAVKLKGTFAVSRWAATYWRKRFGDGMRDDRVIVNTVSGSGLLNPLPLQTNYAAGNAGVAAMTVVHALELQRLGVRVNCVSPSMIRTRLTESVPGMAATTAQGELDPKDPIVVAPLVAYLADQRCSLTGQVLSVRGGTIAVNHGWSKGEAINKNGQPWTVPELIEAVETLALDDPFGRLAEALGGALGDFGRDQLQRMIASQLDAP